MSAADDLRATLDQEFPRLMSMAETQAAVPIAPGKWTAKQTVGHLIDSACNNHGRFVRATLYEDFVFPGYDQDAWVGAQNYNAVMWTDLLDLWQKYNTQIAHVMDNIPQDRLSLQRTPHNLHRIGWQLVPENEPATLGYMIADYVGHMRHHLSQIP